MARNAHAINDSRAVNAAGRRSDNAASSSYGGVLAATSLSYTLVLLDSSIVNVALEEIRHSLNGDVSALQWVVNAYTLVFASLLMTGGTLGDRLGARNVYIAGLSVFTAGSILCGLAPGLTVLILMRALQGVGSAMLVPCSLSLINRAYPDPAKRAAAISVWMGCGGLAMAAGPLVGGILIHLWGWRSIFFVNIPIGLAGIWLTSFVARDPEVEARHFDLAGQTLAVVALGSLIAVLIEGAPLGWQSPPIIAGIVASVLSSALFLAVEGRRRNPMLPLSFFRSGLFSGSTFVSMMSALVFYGILFVFSVYYQKSKGYSPLGTGLVFLPMTAMVAVGGLTSSRIVALLGARWSMCIAFCLYAAGAIGMIFAAQSQGLFAAIVPMLMIGLASGFISPAATAPALGTVDKGRAGVAAAALNSARQTGASLGVAIFGSLIASFSSIGLALEIVLGTVCVLSMLSAAVWWSIYIERREH